MSFSSAWLKDLWATNVMKVPWVVFLLVDGQMGHISIHETSHTVTILPWVKMSEVSSTSTQHYSATCAHTTHHLCFHLGSVPQWCTYNRTAVYVFTHGCCSHLCSVLWWSAYNNTICAGTTCVLTLHCPLVVCLQQHYLCRHYLCSNSTLSFGGLPTTTLSVHALPVFSPL